MGHHLKRLGHLVVADCTAPPSCGAHAIFTWLTRLGVLSDYKDENEETELNLGARKFSDKLKVIITQYNGTTRYEVS